MIPLIKSAICGFASSGRTAVLPGTLQNQLKLLSAGMKTFIMPPDYSDVVIPERQKLKFLNKVPNLKKAKKEMKKLRDIQGPTQGAKTFTRGQYGIVAMGGGYLHWGHMEMMRMTINRKMDTRTTFAVWRINAPYKPITRKGLGQRMGGGKGVIDQYLTPIKYGRLIVEVGGKLELAEVEPLLKQVAKKLPFPAKVVSRESLAAMHQEEEDMKLNNQNPWTFQTIARGNMLGIRKILSPFDLRNHGLFVGKFHNPGRV